MKPVSTESLQVHHTYYYNESNPVGYGLFDAAKAVYCGTAQTGAASNPHAPGMWSAGMISPDWTWANGGSHLFLDPHWSNQEVPGAHVCVFGINGEIYTRHVGIFCVSNNTDTVYQKSGRVGSRSQPFNHCRRSAIDRGGETYDGKH